MTPAFAGLFHWAAGSTERMIDVAWGDTFDTCHPVDICVGDCPGLGPGRRAMRGPPANLPTYLKYCRSSSRICASP
jgi:hypothetical protein